MAQANAVKWLELPHAGADHDHDGVRDDVAVSLRKRYTDVGQRRWPMEIARAGQRHVTSDGNPFAIYRAQAEMQRAMRCLAEGNGQTIAEQVRDEVLGLVLDTDTRRHAYNQSVAKWENDVRHRKLPTRPDDRWQESCGANRPLRKVVLRRSKQPAPAKMATPSPQLEQPALSPSFGGSVDAMRDLPAPNFFITGKVPAKKKPAKRVEVIAPAVKVAPPRPAAPVSEVSSALPQAFRVKPVVEENRLSAAFRVDGQPPKSARAVVLSQAAKTSAAANAGAAATAEVATQPAAVPESGDRREAILLFNQLVRRPEPAGLAAEPEPAYEPPAEPPVAELEIVLPEPLPEPEVEPPPAEPAQAGEDSEEASRHKTEVVVVVKKGQGDTPESTSPEGTPPLLSEETAPGLPPALLDLAPFIKNFRYQDAPE